MEFIIQIKNNWFTISDKIRFLLVGALNAGFSFFLFSIFCLLIGENHYQISLIASWILSSFFSFTTQKFLVFNITGNFFKQYLKCCVTWFFSYLINATLLEIFVTKLSINVYLSQIIATLCCAISTYILFKKFAFKKN